MELFGFVRPRMPIGGSDSSSMSGIRYGRLRLEHGALVAQVELVDDVVLDLALDGLAIGQEAAADPVGHLAEPEVQAGGLDVLGRDGELTRMDHALVDQAQQVLAGEDALAGGKVQHGPLTS